MTLKDRAAELAGRTDPPPPAADPTPYAASIPAEPLPDLDDEIGEPGPDGPDKVPVWVAWSRVMADVRKIGKGDRMTGGGTYNFRGVDRTVNAFGPVLRKHGVLVLPVKVEPTFREARTSNQKQTTETRVVVSWLIIGPEGDQLPMLQSAGESLDSGDKGTAKAQSVAQRVLLLTAAQVPTGDPDPDSIHTERGIAPVRPATDYRDEALSPATSRQRMVQIHHELKTHHRLGEMVMNETGDDEAIGALVLRKGAERFGGDQ